MAGVIACKQHTVISLLRSLTRSQVTPCASVLLQQVRQKGNKRFVLPPTAKEKEKWVPRAKRQAVAEAVVPPKVLEKFMQRVPEDDVWIREHYPSPKYRLVDVLLMHRELASPEMHDNMDGLVVADLELDMSTKKKTKFLSSVSGTVLFPHSFDDGIQNRVVAITKVSELKELALKLGAAYAGGLELIKLIERGEVRHDDYDYVVCDTETVAELSIIKKHLKDNFPTRKKGNLGPDIGTMVNLYVKGRTFESQKETESVARLSQTFGKLNMPDEQLRENFQMLVDTVSSVKASAIGKLIRKVVVRCPPSVEAFVLRETEVVPVARAAARNIPAAEAKEEEEDEPDEKEKDDDDD